jgi:ribulose-phosphate 3-epimerase
MVKVAASLLAADYLHIGDELSRISEAGADWLHGDVRDGSFVPSITFGTDMLRATASITASAKKLPCDVHLMIEAPERHIEAFAEAGAAVITVHAEATRHLSRLLRAIRSCGCLAGVALNPASSPDFIRSVMGEFDLALIMTVNPGLGGQQLMPLAATKIQVIKDMLAGAGVSAELEVDGGVNEINAHALIDSGATVLVAGTALFGARDPVRFINGVKRI